MKAKEDELAQIQGLFDQLKNNDARDNEAFALSQKKFEAVSAGMEINEDGVAETLQEQLIRKYSFIFLFYCFLPKIPTWIVYHNILNCFLAFFQNWTF